MIILYLSNHDLDRDSGVVNKIKSQVSEWKRAEHSVFIFSTQGFKVFNDNFETVRHFKVSWIFLKKTGPIRLIFLHLFSLIVAIKYNPDIVYSRYFYYSPFWTILCWIFNVIVEVNGDDRKELKLKSKFFYLYNHMTRRFFFRSISGVVFVSAELARTAGVKCRDFIVVPNGVGAIELPKVDSVKELLDHNEIHVGFSGTEGQIWHGVDKLIPFFQKSRGMHLHVVGSTGPKLKNVTFYGKVDLQTNYNILSQCDACISSLAFHRIPASEGSPLKSREYVLLGKKIVYAYDDTDLDIFSQKYPDLFMKIENSERNVSDNWHEIELFLRKKVSPSETEAIREIGLNNLTYIAKEKNRLLFFKKMADF